MSREVQSVMLILLGSAITRISLTDVYLRYVKDTLQPFLVATGFLLLLLGFWAMVDAIRSSRKAAVTGDHSHDIDEGAELHDGHNHGEMKIAWLLLLPVLSILLIAPPALGAYSAERDPATVLQPVNSFDPLPPGDPVEIGLNEYAVRAVWDGESTLENRTIAMEGFATPIPAGQRPAGIPEGEPASWWLSRLSLACCAADARATKIVAVGAQPLPANTWVRLTGHWIPGGGTDNDRAIPWIKVDSIQQIPQPKNPYE